MLGKVIRCKIVAGTADQNSYNDQATAFAMVELADRGLIEIIEKDAPSAATWRVSWRGRAR